MVDQLVHVADVKVGRVKGKSRVYPQLRLPSQYADLAGKKASVYEISESEYGTAFAIRVNTEGDVAAYHGATAPFRPCEPAGRSPAEPCRGSDSGSNPDSGALFLLRCSRSFVFSKISDLSSWI
jgi:hypothetical protein